jgi:Co/Zn/Cd efflux system component
MNMRAVFLHFLSDAISSIFVLAVGILLKYYENTSWAMYIDPLSSLFIVGLTVSFSYPLVKQVRTTQIYSI